MRRPLACAVAAVLAAALAVAACSTPYAADGGGAVAPPDRLDAASSADAADGSPPLDAEDDASDAGDASSVMGCADGTREGFPGRMHIAACEGAWSVPGIMVGDPPRCARRAGNDGMVTSGAGCGAADLCATGWHVCNDLRDVALHAGSIGAMGPCNTPSPPGGDTFFATAQSSPGSGLCDSTDVVTDVDDVMGCGDFPNAPDPATCSPLTASISDQAHPSFFSVGDPQHERSVVTKAPGHGGVLCCAD